MKLSRKMAHLALKKVVSITIIGSIVFMLTACPADTAESTDQIDQIDDRAAVTETRDTIEGSFDGIDEPQQSIATMEPTTEATTTTVETTTEETTVETTEAPFTIQGDYEAVMYEDTEYEIRFPTGIDYDDGWTYQTSVDTRMHFGEFVSGLGWLSEGQWTWEDIEETADYEELENPRGGNGMYQLGDSNVIITLNKSENYAYNDFWYQISFVTITIGGDEGQTYVIIFEDHDTGIVLDRWQQLSGSRSDVYFLEYIFWAVANYPDQMEAVLSPFETFKTDENTYLLP